MNYTFDFNRLDPADYTGPRRWFLLLWHALENQVTGHGAHALNGAIPSFAGACLASLASLILHTFFGTPTLPILFCWAFTHLGSVYFYTMREKGLNDWPDNIGDVVWVYALQVQLVLWLFGHTWAYIGTVPLAYDVWYWLSRPAPGWMTGVLFTAGRNNSWED